MLGMRTNIAPVDGKRKCAKCGQRRPLRDFSPGRTDCRVCRVELNQINRWRRTLELEYLRALVRAVLPPALWQPFAGRTPAAASSAASRVGEGR
jgi:hypothetical protein